VPVRDADQVDALGRLLVLGAFRIPVQERVDVNAFAAGRLDAKGRVAQPGECSGHAAETNGGTSDCVANLRLVRRSLISAALVLGAVVADGADARELTLYLVLAAIPAVAIAALGFFGELVEGSADAEAGAVYVGLSSLALVLLVIGAAVRSNTLPDHAVSAL